MNHFTALVCVVSACLVFQAVVIESVPAIGGTTNRIGECSSSQECGVNSCCLIGFTRFSIPTCMPVLEEGETCRPGTGSQGRNVTLWYPNGIEIELTNIFHVMCPCAAGLFCDEKTGTCTRWAKISDQVYSNDLLNY